MCNAPVRALSLRERRLVAGLVLLAWTAVGVAIGMGQEGFSFIYALNFAVGLMTSTGSQQPDNNPTSNFLAGTYMLFGIPLLAVATTLLIESLPTCNEEKYTPVKEITESKPELKTYRF